MTEVWKGMVGYEAYYQVSNLGRVKSNDRIVRSRCGTRVIPGKLLKVGKSWLYPSLTLTVNGKSIHADVHRLVAKAFIPNPENHPVVNHIDGNKDNFSIENLEWCTHAHNERHSWEKLGKKPHRCLLGRKGEQCHVSRPVIAKDLSGKVVGRYVSALQAANELGLQRSKISNVCNGKRRKDRRATI